MIHLVLNDAPVDTSASTVAELVADLLGETVAGHAVAVNGEVVPAAQHAGRRLATGDRVELVTAVAGG